MFMAKAHTQNRNGEVEARELPVEWFTPQPFWPEVKEGRGLANQETLERIRYVKLVIGIFDHRAAGGVAGIHGHSGDSRMDR